jgi:hypothetical protein
MLKRPSTLPDRRTSETSTPDASQLSAQAARALLLEARTRLEREFRELFESGVELPPGTKDGVEAAIDRIGVCLKRLQKSDGLVLEELRVLVGSGEQRSEALIHSLLVDAAVDVDFRGPGLLMHGALPRRSAGARRLAAIRDQIDAQQRGEQANEEIDACERVLRLAIHLGLARLEQLKARYETEPHRLRDQIARRLRAGENPLRMLGADMNQIVRAAARCLTAEDGEGRSR